MFANLWWFCKDCLYIKYDIFEIHEKQKKKQLLISKESLHIIQMINMQIRHIRIPLGWVLSQPYA